ncbi:MAG: hypothetical protein U1A16_01885 [Patescibacteria group bacterium]|nr:hypothetical protein [Patescibacteria group bacterium]
MLLAPHFVVGAVVASTVPNPALGLVLAMASHFVLDQLPHWHYTSEDNALTRPLNTAGAAQALAVFLRIALDVLLGVFLVLLANPASAVFALAGGVVACLPDFFLFLGWQLPGSRVLGWWRVMHQAIHIRPANEPAWPLGVPLQAVMAVGAALLLWRV